MCIKNCEESMPIQTYNQRIDAQCCTDTNITFPTGVVGLHKLLGQDIFASVKYADAGRTWLTRAGTTGTRQISCVPLSSH